MSTNQQTTVNKYATLLNILDAIRAEAPEEFKRYRPAEGKFEELNNARSRAFIHLFLKVKFGVLDFKEREKHITDDPQDGGIDGYYLDADNKKICFFQSKFRVTAKNFEEKEILFTELLQMDVDCIVDGNSTDDKGILYNSKIHKMLSEIQKIPDIGKWKHEVFIIANVGSAVTPSQLKKLTGGFPATIYNHNKVYQELVFPVVQGTHYNPSELRISLDLSNTSSQSAKVTYKVKTIKKECDITLVFVPTLEIARTMHKYRNSILKFNPRSYLELSHNEVNRDIAGSIINLTTNEFALFNNGITILSYGTDFNEKIGQKNKGQLIVTQPQIINGGQTAFTLSRVYEEYVINGKKPEVFDNKEVLLKVITFHPEDALSEGEYLDLIEAISKATNQQSQVNEADRRSNDQIQIQLQKVLFEKYGVFYERKRGEYADGVRAGYIQRSQIIDREIWMRMCKCCDMEPSDAKRMSLDQLFDRQHFEKTLTDPNRFDEYYFAYQCFQQLNHVKKAYAKTAGNKFGVLKYGNGLSQGIYAVVAVCRRYYKGEKSISEVQEIIQKVLDQWTKFERFAVKQSHNSDYFRFYKDEQTGAQREDLNFINYYKGKSLAKDLLKLFANAG
jgi:hypothetical protein